MLILPYNGVWPKIAPSAFIAPTAVIVGDVEIGELASVWFGAVIRGDTAPIRIGARSNLQDNCVIHTDEGAPAIIGAGCSLGHGAIIHGAAVGDGALIGMGAALLNHAEAGAGCIVAAGALVPEGKVIPAGQLAMGAPAKLVRAVSDAERARVTDGIEHYVAYVREYRAALQAAARRDPGHGPRDL
jgi:carbonic anhydrase/acetyltransferase-like protein (isoleucine patch superfamily)